MFMCILFNCKQTSSVFFFNVVVVLLAVYFFLSLQHLVDMSKISLLIHFAKIIGDTDVNLRLYHQYRVILK